MDFSKQFYNENKQDLFKTKNKQDNKIKTTMI